MFGYFSRLLGQKKNSPYSYTYCYYLPCMKAMTQLIPIPRRVKYKLSISQKHLNNILLSPFPGPPVGDESGQVQD